MPDPHHTFAAHFLNPDRSFSIMPFWFWNDTVTQEGIRTQLADFRAKNIYAFIPHPRMGLDPAIGYMTPAFFELLSFAADEAQAHGMKIILYDEASYPSGSAHGEVARRSPMHANKGLAMRRCDSASLADAVLQAGDALVSLQTASEANGRYTQFEVHGCAAQAQSRLDALGSGGTALLFYQTFSGSYIRGLYPDEDDGGASPALYADTMSPDAVRALIELGLEPYYRHLGRHFGHTIIGMFTDEPSATGRGFPPALRAWTPGLMDFMTARGFPEERLWELWCPESDASAQWARLCDARLRCTYYPALADWCTSRGIALTGHPHGGDDMASLDHMHMPGQDIVWRYILPPFDGGTSHYEGAPLAKHPGAPAQAVARYGCALAGPQSTQAKAAADSARHRSRERNVSECFGAYGWRLRMRDMKWLCDWLFARGTNLLVPHAFYYSVRDERAMERPPDVGPHNAWWPHMSLLSDYAARLSALNTNAQSTAALAILAGADGCPWEPCIPFYQNQYAFHYISTALFNEGLVTVREGTLHCAGYTYTHLLCKAEEYTDAVQTLCERAGIQVLFWQPGQPVSIPETLAPTLRLSPPCADIRAARLVKDGRIHYLLTNEGGGSYTGTAALAETTPYVTILDAWRGQAFSAPMQKGAVPLRLGAYESFCLCPADEEEGEPFLPPSHSGMPLPVEFEQPFDAHTRMPLPFPAPGFFHTLPGYEQYHGTVCYPARFTLPASARVSVLCGEVGDHCELIINGHSAGVRFWPPFSFDISPCVHAGENTLSLLVTNSAANQYENAACPSGFASLTLYVDEQETASAF